MIILLLYLLIILISITSISSCEAGYYINATSTICTICIPGSYCLGSINNNKINLCPSGYYGATYGLATSSCTSICYTSGYYCPPGSTSQAQYLCPAGFICTGSYPIICDRYKYCTKGATKKMDCPIGTYSLKSGETSSSCSGYCEIGYYGSSIGNNSKCTGPCQQGYYGNTTGLTISTCSSKCNTDIGYYCPEGSISPYEYKCKDGYYCPGNDVMNDCPKGSYCNNGASQPILCPSGTYGDAIRMNSSLCSGYCDMGHFGSSFGLTISTCSGVCSPGYYCNTGSISAIQNICSFGNYCDLGIEIKCPFGHYGSVTGLSSSNCSGLCKAGYYSNSTGSTSEFCDGVCPENFYCPYGTIEPIACPSGYICQSGSSSPVCNDCSCDLSKCNLSPLKWEYVLLGCFFALLFVIFSWYLYNKYFVLNIVSSYSVPHDDDGENIEKLSNNKSSYIEIREFYKTCLNASDIDYYN